MKLMRLAHGEPSGAGTFLLFGIAMACAGAGPVGTQGAGARRPDKPDKALRVLLIDEGPSSGGVDETLRQSLSPSIKRMGR